MSPVRAARDDDTVHSRVATRVDDMCQDRGEHDDAKQDYNGTRVPS